MYALITRDLQNILKQKANVTPVPKEQLAPNKPYWVPIVKVVNDTSTGPEKIYEPTVQTIYADRVERVRNVRDKTAQEQDDEDQARVDDLLAISGVDRAMAQTLFQVVNDVRVLKGQGTITVAQFKNYLKGLVRD